VPLAHEWLSAEGVPDDGVDTRNLTRRLRERGTMQDGSIAVIHGKNDAGAVDMREQVFRIVAPRGPVRYGEGNLRSSWSTPAPRTTSCARFWAAAPRYARPVDADLAALAGQSDGIPDRQRSWRSEGPGTAHRPGPLAAGELPQADLRVCSATRSWRWRPGATRTSSRMGTGVSINRCRIS